MELVFATNNRHKLEEIQKLLDNRIRLLSLKGIGCTEDIPEEQPTLEGNAHQKSAYIYEKYGYSCFADDTGLEIDALHGEPGVLSARYAGIEKDPEKNMDLVLKKLSKIKNRKARFRTVISLIIDGEEKQFEGIVDGEIIKERTGDAGFGYDPIFRPAGFDETFAQMNIEDKNRISHRGRAVRKLITYIQKL